MRNRLAVAAALVSLSYAAGCGKEFADKPSASVATEQAAPAKAPASQPAGTRLAVDAAKSSIGFVGAKVTGKHDGGFESFEGEARVAGGEPLAVSFTVDMNSVWTDAEKLTGHLKSADFFEVETYPESNFRSTSITPGGPEGATHTITGELTLHGVTKTISFPASIRTGEGGARGTAEFTINRQDFGIAYPGRPDDLIKDDVLLKLDLYFS